jgi:hypothetical protein
MEHRAPTSVLGPVRRPFRALGNVVLPRPDALSEEGWERAEAVIESALAQRPAGVKRQIRLFLRVVNLLPVATTGRTLVGLPPDGRAKFLERLERSRFMLLRRGLWGVRTLAFMGYYTQEPVRQAIGYRASPEGWDLREPEPVTPTKDSPARGSGSEDTPVVDANSDHEEQP